MSIPLATTTITVERRGSESANYETPTLTPIASGVRAVIGSPSGVTSRQGGSREAVTFRLNSDLVELDAECEVTDDKTADRYLVVWAKQRRGLGLDHTVAELQQVTGVGASG